MSHHSHSHMLVMLHACHQHCHTARAKYHRLTNAELYQDNAICKIVLRGIRALDPSLRIAHTVPMLLRHHESSMADAILCSCFWNC